MTMDQMTKILKIAGEVGGILALLLGPYLYFENRKLRRLAAQKNRKIAQAKLEQLKRKEEASFEEKMGSLPAAYGIPSEIEGHDITETKREVDSAVRRREDYFNEAEKLEAEIEEQEEIEKAMTVRGMFGLKPKDSEVIFSTASKQTLMTKIYESLKKIKKYL